MLNKFFALVITSVFSFACYGLDTGSESTADKADHFHFDEFHNQKGISLWDEKKEKTDQSKPTNPVTTKAPDANSFGEGQSLKVREAYKLGNDPALRTIQSLYDAMEALEKQLNTSCPDGWAKEKEWRKPEADHFYIYYQAVCL